MSVFSMEMSAPQESDPKKFSLTRKCNSREVQARALRKGWRRVRAFSMNYANPAISEPGTGYHAGEQEQMCFPLQGKKIELFFNAKSAQRNIIFLFHRYSWLTTWLKTINLSLEGRGLSFFFPLSAEKKTQNLLMRGHSFEMFVHLKQSKAKRELLLRLTF